MPQPYVDLPTLKAQLSITDTTRDTLLTQALNTACRLIDNNCNRRFFRDSAASQRVYNPRSRQFPTAEGVKLLVDDIADTTGMVVEVGTVATGWSPIVAYETGPDNALVQGLPITWLLRTYIPWCYYPLQRIRVTAIWGYPAVPDPVVQAALLQAARLFKRSDSPDGVRGVADWGLIRVSRVDPDVAALLSNYRSPAFA